VILVDTSVWIDHLHATEPELVRLLTEDEVGYRPSVIQELALGSIKQRDAVVGLLGSLHAFPVLTHAEVMTLVGGRRLWGRGLSAVDVHLLGSVALTGGAALWTRDKRLVTTCRDVGVVCIDES
jgi:predicted nucleic acid-binding protein